MLANIICVALELWLYAVPVAVVKFPKVVAVAVPVVVPVVLVMAPTGVDDLATRESITRPTFQSCSAVNAGREVITAAAASKSRGWRIPTFYSFWSTSTSELTLFPPEDVSCEATLFFKILKPLDG
jgi:hypothetical protein